MYDVRPSVRPSVRLLINWSGWGEDVPGARKMPGEERARSTRRSVGRSVGEGRTTRDGRPTGDQGEGAAPTVFPPVDDGAKTIDTGKTNKQTHRKTKRAIRVFASVACICQCVCVCALYTSPKHPPKTNSSFIYTPFIHAYIHVQLYIYIYIQINCCAVLALNQCNRCHPGVGNFRLALMQSILYRESPAQIILVRVVVVVVLLMYNCC